MASLILRRDPPSKRERLRRLLCKKQTIFIFIIITIMIVAPTIHYQRREPEPQPVSGPPDPDRPKLPKPKSLQEERLGTKLLENDEYSTKFHLLLTASNTETNLCKTLMSASVLGYPAPNLIAHNQTFNQNELLGGGSHVAKISSVLQWMDAQPASADHDLVLIADASGGFDYYDDETKKDAHEEGDIWFQLLPEVLLNRYHLVNERANEAIAKAFGDAAEAEGFNQTIIFGAGKRCVPNDAHSVACYPVPGSPLPPTLYGSKTDKLIKNDEENEYSTFRPRYLNTGFIMGPVRDMRKMFKRAASKVGVLAGKEEPHYRGSDQYIFQEIFGEQEFQREVMRRRYHGSDKWSLSNLIKTKEDRLNPSFDHAPIEHKEGQPDEFGIGIDYWSDIGQQTTDAVEDTAWVNYRRSLDKQLARHSKHACKPRVTGNIPSDIVDGTIPGVAVSDTAQFSPLHGWDEVELFTNVCVDTIPVMIHHTGSRKEREHDWPRLWIQPHARGLMEELLERPGGESENALGGAYNAQGEYLQWDELCPANLDREIYREYEDSLI